MQSCTHPCTDPLLLIIIIMVVMARSVGWWAGQSELQRTSGGHRTKCALRNRVLYFTTCVCVCVCVYTHTHTHTHTQQQQMVGRCVPAALVAAARISTRPPLTAASQQDTHTHTCTIHAATIIVVVWRALWARAVCEPVVGPRPSMWPVIGTSEALLLLEREPNAHTRHATPRHAHTRMCVCVCV
jgi:hypothetical protein